MVSRVAKNPVVIPKGVEVTLMDQQLTVKGKLGQLERTIHPMVTINQQDDSLVLAPQNDSTEANALAGTMRALTSNMVIGVSAGFERKMTLVGVGYRASVSGNTINITAGFSHPVNYKLPAGITAETPSATELVLKGVDKQVLGQVAANIRAIRPPEPYKGKGIRYADEHVSLKEVKKK